MKKLVLIISLIIVNILHATTLDEAKEITQKEIEKEIEQKYEWRFTESEDYTISYKFNNKEYIFVVKTWIVSKDDVYYKNYNCFNILDTKQLINGFCKIGKMNIVVKDNYFTISFDDMIPYHYPLSETYYYTFKLINGKFYLHQYSQENFDDEVLDKTFIYYRAPRDEPKGKHRILLDSVNDELLQELESKCYKDGKCKDE